MLARGLPKLNLPSVELTSATGKAIRFKDSGSTDHLLERPPSELAAHKLWRALGRDELTADDILDLSAHLGGVPRFRSGAATSTSFESGQSIEFLKVELVPRRLDDLLRRVVESAPPLPPLLHAIGVYFDTLLIHPLVDGNGRLARLLFLGSIHRTMGLKVPIFPLGPAIALHRSHVMKANFAWYFDHDPRPMLSFASAAVSSMAKLVLIES